MRCIGTTRNWLFFEHASSVVAVDSASLDTTGVISGDPAAALIASASENEWRPPEQSPGFEAATLLASSVFADCLPPSPTFPLPLIAAIQSVSHTVPDDVSICAKRALKWRRDYRRGTDDKVCSDNARVLAQGGAVTLDKVRNIALHWAMNGASHDGDGWEIGTPGYPSIARIDHDLWGGDAGRDWSRSTLTAALGHALLAAAYDIDAGMSDDEEVPEADSLEQDPTKKHHFEPELGGVLCTYCNGGELNPVHDFLAPAYSTLDIDTDKSHFFVSDTEDDTCGLCDRPVDDDLHKQAALASYYEFKDLYDELYAGDAEFRKKITENPEPEPKAVSAGVGYQNDPVERAALARESADELFWGRQGTEEEDPLTYFVSASDADEMVVDAVYVFDGRSFYRLDPEQQMWTPQPVSAGEHLYPIDDESAYVTINALLFSPEPFDLREVDPGESYLMDSCAPHVDLDSMERSLVSDAGVPAAPPPPAAPTAAPAQGGPWAGYTAEERARNASRQGRDSGGKFAPSAGGAGGKGGGGAKAKIAAPSPPMTPADFKALFDGFAAYVTEQRAGKSEEPEPEAEAPEEEPTPKTAAAVAPAPPVAPAPAAAPAPPAAPEGEAPTASPEQSDVKPINMAVMDPGDPTAVLDLISLVPASATSTVPKLFKRVAGGVWEEDLSLLRQIQGLHPPLVQTLDDTQYGDVMNQVDQFYVGEGVAASAIYGPYGELVAAGIPGIADTPSDIAATEKLKRYWTIGRGGTVKIRWNTPGDWTRCNKHLRKYMGPRAKGYCANLHKAMTGVWPGDRRNIGKRNRSRFSSLGDPYDVLSSADVITAAATFAEFFGEPAPLTAAAVPAAGGAKFVIPMLAPVGVKSGDGREFAPNSLSYRELPIPLLWQIKTQNGHDESVIVGRIDSIDTLEEGALGNARGVFDIGPYAKEAERMVRDKFLRGVSVDLDEFEAESEDEDAGEGKGIDISKIAPGKMRITGARAMAATLVAKPAFQQCSIELDDDDAEEITMVADGTYIADPSTDKEYEELVQSALVAAGIPLHPPREWFNNPELTAKTPLTVHEDGRVFGHIATWDVDHIGLPFSTRPPKSSSNYAYFHTGVIKTDDGSDVPVGQITLVGGHADLHANAAAAARHYDDTASAFCDVRMGEDKWGIWASGALRTTVTGDQLRAIRASAPSGDWRPINGRLELVAVCQVNTPGFPNTRAMVSGGQLYALVAAGTSVLNRMRAQNAADQDGLSLLSGRLAVLEAERAKEVEAARSAAIERMAPARAAVVERHRQTMASLAARVAPVRQERDEQNRQRVAALIERISADDSASMFADYSQEKRDEYSKKGWALKDGSYPIANVADLRRAISAYGRAKQKAPVRRHIRKRAKALGKSDLIPESWGEASIVALDGFDEITELFGPLIAAGGLYPDGTPWDPQRHPRDDRGRFRQAIARIREAAVKARKEEIVQAADAARDAEESGNLDEAKEAARDVLKRVDDAADDIGDVDTAEELREGYTDLGTAVANLPLAMGDKNEKFRFTELPPELQSLVKDLLSRVESRLEPEQAEKASDRIKKFISGVDLLSQPEISAELSRMLRYLI